MEKEENKERKKLNLTPIHHWTAQNTWRTYEVQVYMNINHDFGLLLSFYWFLNANKTFLFYK